MSLLWRKFAPWVAAISLIAVAILAPTTVVYRTRYVAVLIERDAKAAEVAEFVGLATEATVEPDAKGHRKMLSSLEARAAIRALSRDRADKQAALVKISRNAQAARARSIASDAGLVHAQAVNRQNFAKQVAPRVEKLTAIKPTGDRAQDQLQLSNTLDEAFR